MVHLQTTRVRAIEVELVIEDMNQTYVMSHINNGDG